MAVKEAKFWISKDSLIECRACELRCKLASGDVGTCGVRTVVNGKLFITGYGKLSKLEIKTFKELPLSNSKAEKWLIVGGFGCNLKCSCCKSYNFTNVDGLNPSLPFLELSPGFLIKETAFYTCKGLCFSFNEPSVIIEYVIDSFRIAKKYNIETAIFTNGTFTEDVISELEDCLDYCIVDVKAFSPDTMLKMCNTSIKPERILENVKKLHLRNINIEIVTTIIPSINDSFFELKSIARWIKYEIGKDTPWHLFPFKPTHKFYYLNPLNSDKLLKVAAMALEEGLERIIIHS